MTGQVVQMFMLWSLFLTASSMSQQAGGANARVDYDPDTVYTYNYDMDFESLGFSQTYSQGGSGDDVPVDKQQLSCSCDVTPVKPEPDDDGWLLQLEVHDVHHRVIDSYGRHLEMASNGLDQKMGRNFFFVQRPDGHVPYVYYPSDESDEIVDMKKGMANMFRSRTDVFQPPPPGAGDHEQEQQPHSDPMPVQLEEEDHTGRHNVTYSMARQPGGLTVVTRHRRHDPTQYVKLVRGPQRSAEALKDSSVFERQEVHVDHATGKIRAVHSEHYVKLDHGSPRFVDEVRTSRCTHLLLLLQLLL